MSKNLKAIAAAVTKAVNRNFCACGAEKGPNNLVCGRCWDQTPRELLNVYFRSPSLPARRGAASEIVSLARKRKPTTNHNNEPESV